MPDAPAAPPAAAPGAGATAAPFFATKLCPLMTATGLSKPKSALMLPAGPQSSEPEAISCQGPACMWFIQSQDGGGCAVTFAPIALGQMIQTIATVGGNRRG